MFNLQQIRQQTFVNHVDFHVELESTNDRGLELCRRGIPLETPVLVLSERQTAGRGRGSNQWWSSAGSLTFSVVLELNRFGKVLQYAPRVALFAGLAVAESLCRVLPNASIGLKWPNDVWLQDRKVCGILAETARGVCDYVVVGIGINVNNSFSQAPSGLETSATSLVDFAGHTFDLTEVLVQVLRQLQRELQLLPSGGNRLSDRWTQFCVITGAEVDIEIAGQHTRGLCQGIDATGALILSNSTGEHCFYSGQVNRIVPSAESVL